MKKAILVRCIRLVLSLALLAVLVLGTTARAAASSVIYVKFNAMGANNGSSWADAYKSLQKALAAAVSGQEIWVAEGVYKPTGGTDRTISFVLKAGVAIYGSFAGTETSLSERNPKLNVTKLSGDIGAAGMNTDNSYHVVNAGSVSNSAILDGFTIDGGYADGISLAGMGGGMFAAAASPTLRNLIFSNNVAIDNGGGIWQSHGSPTLSHVTFASNYAYFGGGMYNDQGKPSLAHVTFLDNIATNGGGGMINVVSNPILSHVTFDGNGALSVGGGMLNAGSSPKLTKVVFGSNSAQYGGGMYNISGSLGPSNPALSNVSFSRNIANYGGGMANLAGSNPRLSKVTFSNNKANEGGGMYNRDSSPALKDVVFDSNEASGGAILGGGMYNENSNALLKRVTFSGNKAGEGAGMYNLNCINLGLTNVTFYNNYALIYGGAIANHGSFPALVNVTVSGNTGFSGGGGGMYNADGSGPGIFESIIYLNGGGVLNDATSGLGVWDSILEGGCPAAGSSCTNIIIADPQLGPLHKNGGFTKTMALGAESGAIDEGGGHFACATTDQRGVKRPQGGGCDLGAYEVRALSFPSAGNYDGWTLESGETSSAGGSASTAGTLLVGDDSSNRQYRSITSFDSSALPDGASIVYARILLRRQSTAGDANIFGTHGNLLIDLAKPYFGSGLSLDISDFQATATVNPAGAVIPVPAGSIYAGPLNSSGRAGINKLGTTQLRLRFSIDDDNDHVTDTLAFYSGDEATVSLRPRLVVYYNP